MPSVISYQMNNSKMAATQREEAQPHKVVSKVKMVSGFHQQLRANPDHHPPLIISKAVRGAPPDAADAEKGHYQSSGSEHEPSSVCLAAMVHEFMEDQQSAFSGGRSLGSKEHKDRVKDDLGGELLEILKGLVPCSSNVESTLLDEATKALSLVREQAVQICREEGVECTSGCLKRAAMRRLRETGYNAAICKSRWDHAGGFPGGDYEYMDVLIDSGGRTERLILDVDFRGQFEIARPTDRYTSIFQELPHIYVGGTDRLQKIVNLMSDAVKRSLKKREMPVPPWRKLNYMRAKWFSAYKRTTNEIINAHESTDVVLRRELTCTAMRGSRWDSSARFRAAVECHHAKTSRNEITVVTTDWKPPAVVGCRKPSRVAGLASVLIEAGMSTLAKQQQQQQQQQQTGSGKMNMVAVS